MDDHNKILIEELEKRLLWYREEASGREFDPEAVDAICTMLQKLSPEQEPHRTKEEAFENIMRQIRLEEAGEGGESEDFGRKREESRLGSVGGENSGSAEKAGTGKVRRFLLRKSGMRAAVIVIAVVGIFFSLDRVTYARENKSLFTMILERVGWLEIEKEKGEENSVIGFGEETEAFYDSWADLDGKVKARIAVPLYIPEGYFLYGIRSWNSEDRKILQSNYYNEENGHILIEITLWEDSEDHYRENASEEGIYKLLSEYSDENTLYYEYNDEYICMAFMENSFYRISGNITLEDMIKIREGLGETIPK